MSNFSNKNNFNTNIYTNTNTSFAQPNSFISRPSQSFGSTGLQNYSTNNNLSSTFINSGNNFNIDKNNLNSWQNSTTINYQPSSTISNNKY